jgi:purine-binding chemotaxis protein CheW
VDRPYVVFSLAGGTYALPSDVILHLSLPGDITPVPNAPPAVEGVTAIRGRVTPVLNLRRRFGFPANAHEEKSRLVVVSTAGREVALRVDAAREFATLAEESITPLEGVSKDVGGEYVKGTAMLGDRIVMILDAHVLLNGLKQET